MIGIPLIEHDPELFAGLDNAGLHDARDAIVPAWQIEEGVWTPPALDPSRTPFGLLLLDGFLAHEITLADASSMELLGPGDVLRPWVGPAAANSEVEVAWEALETTVVAALDGRFGSVALRHPVIIATLMDRYAARSASAVLHLAVCHIVGLDKRLEAMFWHLAEQWGRVSREGVILPLRLSHEFLAKLVGVRRPSATSAISRLRHDGIVERRPDGSWLLHGRPPAELTEVREAVMSVAH
jgi:CRP/FNR family cyclic AMP-dependent transcriptional regulator